MRRSWKAGKKVEALKTAIRAAKMMGDHHRNDISSYPMQFMHVATLLDEFGQLVYDHIKSSAPSTDEAEAVPSSEDWGVGYNKRERLARQKIMEYRAGESRKIYNSSTSSIIISPRRVVVQVSRLASIAALG